MWSRKEALSGLIFQDWRLGVVAAIEHPSSANSGAEQLQNI